VFTTCSMSVNQEKGSVYYKLLSHKAFIPFCDTGSVEIGLRSPITVCIPRRGKVLIDLFLEVFPPPNTYSHVVPRLGLSSKYNIELGGGENYSEYEGSLKIQLYNHSNVDYHINRGAIIAGLIFEKIVKPTNVLGISLCMCNSQESSKKVRKICSCNMNIITQNFFFDSRFHNAIEVFCQNSKK